MEQRGETSVTAEPSVLSVVMSPPLCVDLDGTLIATDSLWEALLILFKTRPLELLRAPFWIRDGKARLKTEIARRAAVDVTLLPYRPQVLQVLEAEKRGGRRLVLATASHHSVAEAVAAHLGLFHEIVATRGAENCSGQRKLDALEKRFGPGNFDYMGDSAADLCLWRAARRAYLVGASRRISRRAAMVCAPYQVLPAGGVAGPAIRAMRPQQWVKNLLVLVPIVLAHQILSLAKASCALRSFWAFCFCASAIYILNDLMDLEADRRHPRKQRRPFASGALSARAGVILAAVWLVAGFGVAASLPAAFVFLLAAYVGLTTIYSFWLKRKLLLDVILLASLYTQRIIAGAAAINVTATMWLLAFSMFFFLSLAFAKRYSELLGVEDMGGEKIGGREYRVEDLRIIESVGPASGYLSVLVFCNYLDSPLVRQLYPRPQVLWLVAPLLLYWITRIWFFARRRAMNDDPIAFAVRDRVSRITGLLLLIILVVASAHWRI